MMPLSKIITHYQVSLSDTIESSSLSDPISSNASKSASSTLSPTLPSSSPLFLLSGVFSPLVWPPGNSLSWLADSMESFIFSDS